MPPFLRRLAERRLARVEQRAKGLIAPGETVLGSAFAQARLRPLWPALALGVGAAILVNRPAGDEPAALAAALTLGGLLLLGGAGLQARLQRVVLVTEGTVYVLRLARFASRGVAIELDAPRERLEGGPAGRWIAVGEHRYWALIGGRERLAAAGAGRRLEDDGSPWWRSWQSWVAIAVGLALVGLALGRAITTDSEAVREAFIRFNELVADADGDACRLLSEEAKREFVGTAVAQVKRRGVERCESAVMALGGLPEGGGSEGSGGGGGGEDRGGGGRSEEVGKVTEDLIQSIAVRGQRARVRVGFPDAFQDYPLRKQGADWVLTRILVPFTVTRAKQAPSGEDYRLRIRALCQNAGIRQSPLHAEIARLVRLAPAGQPSTTLQAVVERGAAIEAKLAADLRQLRPPAEPSADLPDALEDLDRAVRTNGALARAFATGDPKRVSAAIDPRVAAINAFRISANLAGLDPTGQGCGLGPASGASA